METTITSSSLDCGEATFAKGRTVPDCQRMQFLPKLFGERLMLAERWFWKFEQVDKCSLP